MTEVLPLLRYSLSRADNFWLIAFQDSYTIAPQRVDESIRAGVASASNDDDQLCTIGNGVTDDLVVVSGSRNEVVVKGIRPQGGEFLLTKPSRTPSIQDP